MSAGAEKFIIERLRQSDLSFGQKLRLVSIMIPQVDEVTGVVMVRSLLGSALISKPTLKDLYDLCEVSGSMETLHEYLRGFFLVEDVEKARIEMAERLDEVIIYRMSQKRGGRQDLRLKQTIADYLLRARN